MSDRFHPLPFDRLANWVFSELEAHGSIFDIPGELFFCPAAKDPFQLKRGEDRLATPFGVAAGPHTQLASGILASWLCGARTLELKTVQRRAVEVVRPCIRMRDEGLNVEFSQELDPAGSFGQYLDAWVLIHALFHLLAFEGPKPGTVCDISVGYDLEGLRSPEMREYFARVRDAGKLLEQRLDALAALESFPGRPDGLDIDPRIAHRVTLSTLHGCPAGEIGAMLQHLMIEEDFDVQVKLNPSLLGADFVRHILHDELGFLDLEPDEEAFAADLGIDEAVDLIAAMRSDARAAGRSFGIKLSNTLPLRHRGSVFDASEKTMYLSGRPLHPLTVQIAAALRDRCGAGLEISFCGGADAFNAADLLACGLAPVTTCSDLLRPGGIPRLGQYMEESRTTMGENASIEAFILNRAAASGFEGTEVEAAALHNLHLYAGKTLSDPRWQHETYHRSGRKARRGLELFDCIEAPCMSSCGIKQQVPEYMRRVAAGDDAGAATIIRQDNPLPLILGRSCHHPCEDTCLRSHYDEPMAIRDIKRFALEYGGGEQLPPGDPLESEPVAVIGAGPCGLAAARECRLAGLRVTVFEAEEQAGGMVHATIPVYRAGEESVISDLLELEKMGIEFRFGKRFGRDFTLLSLREEGFGPVVLAAGAPRGRPLGLEGEENDDVIDGLSFLRRHRRGLGGRLDGLKIGVIGAGDVAMDCARTAVRLGAEVEIIYRRRRRDAPAHPEELRALDEENIAFLELLSPESLEIRDGRLAGLYCRPMRAGAPGADGRPRPEATGEEARLLQLDLLVVAIGQLPDPAVAALDGLEKEPGGWIRTDGLTGRTSIPGLWAGGDAVRGPSSIVDAAGDGKVIAADILGKSGGGLLPHGNSEGIHDLIIARSRRIRRRPTPELPAGERRNFEEVIRTMHPADARAEAARCLDCDELCSTCVTVCPNRAFMTLSLEPFSVEWPLEEDGRMQRFEIRQSRQVLLFADFCNACGNCSEFCPTTGHPHLDKARLTLDEECFHSSTEAIFKPCVDCCVFELSLHSGGAYYSMRFENRFEFSGPQFSASLDPETGKLIELGCLPGVSRPLDWGPCHALLVVGRALRQSRPELLKAFF